VISRGRVLAVGQACGVTLAAAALVTGCASQPQRSAAQPQRPAARPTPRRHTIRAHPRVVSHVAPGGLGSYRVGKRKLTFYEPAHTGPSGQWLGLRPLLTLVRYPVARPPDGSRAAAGKFPLLVFAPGFLQCAQTYAPLLHSWASAGYVVAAVDFPRTDCRVGAAAYEADLINQPADMSYVISRLLADSARPGDFLSGRLTRREIAAAGQSDGGDTVAALAANTCCADHRLAAAAVLSGAEWPPMPGRYFARRGLDPPPMLFVQGSADPINPPWTSVQLYRADWRRPRYYLDLFGANHMIPYAGADPVERLVAKVTLAFFDRYVLRQARARARMRRDGNVAGRAELLAGDRLPPSA
jgi:dienelactone hydrolase